MNLTAEQNEKLQEIFIRGLCDGLGEDITCLEGADLRGADLRGADLRGADLEDADLARAVLPASWWRGCLRRLISAQRWRATCVSTLSCMIRPRGAILPSAVPHAV